MRVLLITSDAAVAARVGEALEAAIPPWPTVEQRRAADVDAALDAIEDEAPACAVVDATGGDLEPLRLLREVEPTVPVVAVVADAGAAVAARSAGAHDHVVLPDLAPEPVHRALEHAVERADAQASRRAADDELVQFARKVAHGLRNPLAIATGMLDLLDRQVGEQLEDEMHELLTRSSDALRRAGDLVLALQRYASAIRSEDRLVSVALGRTVEQAAESSGVLEAGGHLDVGQMPTVLGDREALARVFHELLDNAVRHAGTEHPPSVVVRAEDAGDHWRITITDDGPGIPAEQREAAFAEGERLGRMGDGFGLGLAAVRAIVARNGGRTSLEDGTGGRGLRAVVEWPKAALTEESLGQQGP